MCGTITRELQLGPEPRDLRLQCRHGSAGVLVKYGSVRYHLGSLRERQCRDRLGQRRNGGTHSRHEARLAVAAERIPKEEGQFRIPELHMFRLASLSVDERVDHLTEDQKRTVDHARLLQSIAVRRGGLLPFASGEIDQRELGMAHLANAVLGDDLGPYVQHEHGMRAGRYPVHVRRRHAPIGRTATQRVHRLGRVGHLPLVQPLDVHALCGIFPHR